MEWKNLPSTIKYSRKNIEKELLEYIKSLSLSRNALFKGTVPLVATVVELDKEEQCNAAEGRGYANGNGWVRSLQQPILDNQWNSLFTLFKVFSLLRIRDFLLHD